MRSPLRWFGSKYRLLGDLVALIPPHNTWVDVFFGGGSVTIAKPPSPVEIANDLDSSIVHFFRTLQDPAKALELERRAWLTPYSREWFESMRDDLSEPVNDVDRAYRFFVVNRMSFGGWSCDKQFPAWSYSISLERGNVGASVDVWQGGIRQLVPVCRRLRNPQVEQDDFRTILDRYDTPATCFYLDPPYHPDVRARGGYRHEMTDSDHHDLTARCLELEGMAILSGYRHEPIHEPLEAAGWQRRDFETRIFCSGKAAKKNRRTESVWMNPAACQSGQLSLMLDAG